MAENHRTRGTIKFVVWTVISVGLFVYAFSSYSSGQMKRWYYYTAAFDGYAIHAQNFKDATKEKPGVLKIVKDAKVINGLEAVPVKKGDRLPDNTNGIISNKIVQEGKRAKLDGDKIVVTVPWQIQESKGFKYKDTFTHKGIETNPWSGVWNVAIVISVGLALGLMAEGLTDMLGWKIKKIEHYGH